MFKKTKKHYHRFSSDILIDIIGLCISSFYVTNLSNIPHCLYSYICQNISMTQGYASLYLDNSYVCYAHSARITFKLQENIGTKKGILTENCGSLVLACCLSMTLVQCQAAARLLLAPRYLHLMLFIDGTVSGTNGPLKVK